MSAESEHHLVTKDALVPYFVLEKRNSLFITMVPEVLGKTKHKAVPPPTY